MKRNRRKRQTPPILLPRRLLQEQGEQRTFEPHELETLTRSELVALILGQQASRALLAETPADTSAAEDVAHDDTTAPTRPALMIDFSIRSGQTIEFPGGDVTVIGSVGSGAEIIAGGSIHVYGTLRGRAIAGTSGDQSARIFCQDFDAELLCIDGRYRVADNLDRELRGRPIQARLEGTGMTLIPLESSNGSAARESVRERGSTDRFWRATDRMKQLISAGVTREPTLLGAAAR
jgi:septum site-determining protein MinC